MPSLNWPSILDRGMRALLLAHPIRMTFGLLMGVVLDGISDYVNATSMRSNEWVAATTGVGILQWIAVAIVLVYLLSAPFVLWNDHFGSRRLPPDYVAMVRELERLRSRNQLSEAQFAVRMQELQTKLVRTADFSRGRPIAPQPTQPA